MMNNVTPERASEILRNEIVLDPRSDDPAELEALEMGAAALLAVSRLEAEREELVEALQSVMRQLVPHPKCIDLEDSSAAFETAFGILAKHEAITKVDDHFEWTVLP